MYGCAIVTDLKQDYACAVLGQRNEFAGSGPNGNAFVLIAVDTACRLCKATSSVKEPKSTPTLPLFHAWQLRSQEA